MIILSGEVIKQLGETVKIFGLSFLISLSLSHLYFSFLFGTWPWSTVLLTQILILTSKVATAKRKLERLQFSTSSSFVKIWSACSGEFKAYFWTFWALYKDSCPCFIPLAFWSRNYWSYLDHHLMVSFG